MICMTARSDLNPTQETFVRGEFAAAAVADLN
jgi:hypothetical protein